MNSSRLTRFAADEPLVTRDQAPQRLVRSRSRAVLGWFHYAYSMPVNSTTTDRDSAR
jgi:hypothetical protein